MAAGPQLSRQSGTRRTARGRGDGGRERSSLLYVIPVAEATSDPLGGSDFFLSSDGRWKRWNEGKKRLSEVFAVILRPILPLWTSSFSLASFCERKRGPWLLLPPISQGLPGSDLTTNTAV